MSIRTKVLGFVDVMMRVPPIIVIDEILKIGMGLPTRFYPGTATLIEPSVITSDADSASKSETTVNGESKSSDIFRAIKSFFSGASFIINKQDPIDKAIDNATASATGGGMLTSSFNLLMDELARDTSLSEILSLTSVKFFICLLAFLCAACVFMLWTRQLVMIYMFLTSLALTFFSYWSNLAAIDLVENSSSCLLEDILSFNTTRLLDSSGIIVSLVPHIVAQWFMGIMFAYLHLGPRFALLQKSMPFLFASPIVLALLPLPPRMVKQLPLFACIVPILLTQITIMGNALEASRIIYNGYQYAMNFVSSFGLSALIENEWQRLNVPNVLRVFWTIRVGQGLYAILTTSDPSFSVFLTTQKLMVDGCETLTAVLGMTAVISAICHYIGRSFQWYLLTFDNDEDKSLGTVSAVLFYILALQTGLTSLPPEKRFVRLCRNLCLLSTALLHFLHNIVSPILMSLSAARNPSRKRHVRALTVCAFLIVVPIGFLWALWSRHTASTWLLAVTAFSVEVVIKVLVSLATYMLFILDARRQFFWEKLDDYLYYVRAFGNSVEFCFGILLFMNGGWILMFESGGAIRAIMMCIHAYFNIWCEARAGWSVFMKRRSAVYKIAGLPEATPSQLQAFDDVCAICYQEMYSAKITRCRHFFHGVCLRKWLYVQDRCPLCHEIMMYTDKADETDGGNDVREPEADAEQPLRIYPRDDGLVGSAQRHTPERNVSTASIASPEAAEVSSNSVNTPTSSLNATPSSTSATSATASASVSAAAVATAAASNATHMFRLSNDLGTSE